MENITTPIENYFKQYKNLFPIIMRDYRLLKEFYQLSIQNPELQIYVTQKEEITTIYIKKSSNYSQNR
jgi:hypothetical protein